MEKEIWEYSEEEFEEHLYTTLIEEGRLVEAFQGCDFFVEYCILKSCFKEARTWFERKKDMLFKLKNLPAPENNAPLYKGLWGKKLLPQDVLYWELEYNLLTDSRDYLPMGCEGLCLEADLYTQTKDFSKAVNFYSAAIEMAPNWVRPLYSRALAYLHQDQSLSALEDFTAVNSLFKRGYKESPQAAATLLREDKCALPNGTYRAFLEYKENRDSDLRHMIKRCPDYAPFHLLMANLEPENALLHFRNARRHHPCRQTREEILIAEADFHGLSSKGYRNALGRLIFNPKTTLQSEYRARELFLNWYQETPEL